jgi:hypothetical protein
MDARCRLRRECNKTDTIAKGETKGEEEGILIEEEVCDVNVQNGGRQPTTRRGMPADTTTIPAGTSDDDKSSSPPEV